MAFACARPAGSAKTERQLLGVFHRSVPNLLKQAPMKGSTLGNTQVGTLCVDDEITSMSTDCLREDLSSSDDDETSWVSLGLWVELKALELKKSGTSTRMRLSACRGLTKTLQAAWGVGDEEEASGAFLTNAWNHPDFDQHADNGGSVFTCAMRSVSVQLAEGRVTSQIGTQGMGSTSSPAVALFDGSCTAARGKWSATGVPKMVVLFRQGMRQRICKSPKVHDVLG
eukprot:4539196-Amphidinium_carterae.1